MSYMFLYYFLQDEDDNYRAIIQKNYCSFDNGIETHSLVWVKSLEDIFSTLQEAEDEVEIFARKNDLIYIFEALPKERSLGLKALKLGLDYNYVVDKNFKYNK